MYTNDMDTLRLVTRERTERFAGEARAESLARESRNGKSTTRRRTRRSFVARIALSEHRR
jgi:hypothetical protein